MTFFVADRHPFHMKAIHTWYQLTGKKIYLSFVVAYSVCNLITRVFLVFKNILLSFQAVGIALETRRLDVFEQAILKSVSSI